MDATLMYLTGNDSPACGGTHIGTFCSFHFLLFGEKGG